MDRFKNKYRSTSARLQHWDYKWAGAYFITICTQNRVHYFGNVVDGEMRLSQIGGIADSEWLKTFEMRPDMNLWLGPYVVMPNHFHAIIGIGQNQYNSQRDPQRDSQRDPQRRAAMHCVSTNPDNDNGIKNQFGPQSKNLASIILGFKIGVTKNARLINPDFKWQPRFYDHIIRNEKSSHTISNYIKNNQINWKEDKFYKILK